MSFFDQKQMIRVQVEEKKETNQQEPGSTRKTYILRKGLENTMKTYQLFMVMW